MLTTAQTDYFAMFGFAVLRGFLADRAAALRAEADAAIRDAYAATYDERVCQLRRAGPAGLDRHLPALPGNRAGARPGAAVGQ
jgi:hypothetical protein